MSLLRALPALVAASVLSLTGCTRLLGDFKYDPNPAGSGGTASTTPDQQGDIVVVPDKGLVTTEQGGKATFTIALKRKPTANVAIALSSSKPTEGTVSPISVSFTPDNYNAPQTVQVTGVDDNLPDGTQYYNIRTSPATSDDPTYFGLDPLDPEVRNVDDETAGFTLMPPSGLVVSESGTEATFTIALNHAPTAGVVIGLSSDTPTEGTVSPMSLTFTPDNWMAPQIVTVTGVNDDIADGPKKFKIITAAASSADTAYDHLDPDDEEITNQDNDSAGVTLTPATGLMTYENGAMTTFGIALNSPPTKDVTIPLQSSNEAEGTIQPDHVTFTSLNWMAPQIVTVTGVDDDRADGNQPYQIRTLPALSDDPGYSNFDGPDAEVINIDDDSPGVLVTPTLGLTTSEEGASATFTVALASKPSGEVHFDVTSSRPTEGTVTPATLVFTELNWAAPQTVTVTGVDDQVADGMQTYVVHVTPDAMATVDPAYGALLETDVSLSNIDNDSAGITVNAASGLTTTEAGGMVTFTVALNSQPTADVTIPLTSNDTTEGTVSPAQLVFTAANWRAPQTVTVTGVNDDMADGNQPYRILTEVAQSQDANYNGMNASNVDISNIDDDSAGITENAANQPLVTSESGGTATFTLVLNSQPTAEVDIAVESNNTAEGTVNVDVLKFTPDNWRAPQTVTVKGVDDDSTADGAQPYRIRLMDAQSADPNYNGMNPPDVRMVNTDNDSAGITLKNTQNLTTKEDGSTAAFQVVLNSKPTAPVTIALTSSRVSEGTVSPASVTFTGNNWAAPQTVTIMGVDDKVADGSQQFRINTAAAQSGDPLYNGMDPADPTVTNIDNDSAGISVSYSPMSGISTKEGGGTATFTVVLNSQPTADVTIPLHSTNMAEGTVTPSSLTFTAQNWNAPRTVTVTGADDQVADGAQPYTVALDPAKSQDPNYNGLDGTDVPAQNIDNDSAGISVSKPSGDTKEPNGTATFTVVLNSQPTANVTIGVSSSNLAEGTVSPSSLTFTPLNWAAPQKVTVTGVDDQVADGPQPYTVLLAPATSTDTGYNKLDADDVSLSNIDNDSAGITVSAVKGTTSEGGGTASFTIQLNSQPTASVTIPLSSSDVNEGTLAITQVVFTTTDYASPKTVTITGVDDMYADGNQPYTIVLGAAVSTDKGYSGLDAPDAAVTNVDDDTAGLSVNATEGTTSEKGTTFSFTIALTSKPTADVTVPVASTNVGEGTVSPPSLKFTTNNWKSAQTVTVTGVDDDVADGAASYAIQINAATSTDPGYSGFDYPFDVSMTNTDNDSAGIEVSKALGNTSEKGTTTTFSIQLLSQPTADVTIPLSSSDSTEGSLTVTQVVFTAQNWSTPQVITVHGENDKIADGAIMYSIVTGVAKSADTNYAGLNPDDVSVTNLDDDTAGVQVSMASGPTSEAGGKATFTIVLTSQPTAPVSVPVSSNNLGEGTVDVTSVDFTTSNWATPQTVTVTGVDDSVADSAQDYLILVDPPMTTDTNYAAIDPDNVAMVNTDNDSAAFNIVPPAMNMTSEAAGGPEVTFSVVLTSKPTGTVTIPLTSSNELEGVISAPATASLKFLPADWDQAQTVTIVGVDDSDIDGDKPYSIQVGPPDSTDPKYSTLGFQSVNLVNLDNDGP